MRIWKTGIGHGWQASLSRGATGRETLTLTHPATDRSFALPDESVQRLRAIFAGLDKGKLETIPSP